MGKKTKESGYEQPSSPLSDLMYRPSKEAVATGKREPYHLTYIKRMQESQSRAAAEKLV